jgi:hypothetical protein
MTSKDDIIRIARKAGFTLQRDERLFVDMLERFADLAVKPWADQLEVERKRFQELNDVVATGMQHARAAEREACAKVCDELHPGLATKRAAEIIRARGQA